jgi:hypothetical protein
VATLNCENLKDCCTWPTFNPNDCFKNATEIMENDKQVNASVFLVSFLILKKYQAPPFLLNTIFHCFTAFCTFSEYRNTVSF